MLQYHYDEERDVMQIEGLNYSGDLLRAFAHDNNLSLNQPFIIIERRDGVITIQKLDNR